MVNLNLPPKPISVKPGPVSIDSLSAQSSPDGLRIRVSVAISGEGQRPNLDLIIHDVDGNELSKSTIIETMDEVTEFTMHLRGHVLQGDETLTCRVYFDGADFSSHNQIRLESASH